MMNKKQWEQYTNKLINNADTSKESSNDSIPKDMDNKIFRAMPNDKHITDFRPNLSKTMKSYTTFGKELLETLSSKVKGVLFREKDKIVDKSDGDVAFKIGEPKLFIHCIYKNKHTTVIGDTVCKLDLGVGDVDDLLDFYDPDIIGKKQQDILAKFLVQTPDKIMPLFSSLKVMR